MAVASGTSSGSAMHTGRDATHHTHKHNSHSRAHKSHIRHCFTHHVGDRGPRWNGCTCTNYGISEWTTRPWTRQTTAPGRSTPSVFAFIPVPPVQMVSLAGTPPKIRQLSCLEQVSNMFRTCSHEHDLSPFLFCALLGTAGEQAACQPTALELYGALRPVCLVARVVLEKRRAAD
jgi:hypothetical protein